MLMIWVLLLLVSACDSTTEPSSREPFPTLLEERSGGDGAVTIVASPEGAGSTCSASAPCSIEQAKTNAALAARRGNASKISVELSDGIYRLRRPLRFGPDDSGAQGNPIVWRPRAGAHPVVAGSMQPGQWKLTDDERGIWSVSVPDALRTRQIYAKGNRIPMAQGAPPVAMVGSMEGYIAADSTYAGWRNPEQLEFVYPGGSGMWTEPRCRVQSITGRRIAMAEPCWTNATNRPRLKGPAVELPSMSTATVPSRIENAYELIEPGQFYLDEKIHVLHYRPLPDLAPSDVQIEVPELEQLIVGEGTLDTPVHDIVFTGITFAYATWNEPSTRFGFAEIQANIRITGEVGAPPQGTCMFSEPGGTCPYGSYSREPGNIVWHAADGIRFIENRFEHLGAAALVFEYGGHGSLIEGNVFHDISGIAIQVGDTVDPHPSDVGADDREICAFNTISNNLIGEVGAEFHGAVGIMLFFTRHSLVHHNEIRNVPYTAISSGAVGGHANVPGSPDTTTSVNSDNDISYNVIYDYMNYLNDGGAIYLEGHQNETVVRDDGSIDAATSYAHGLKAHGNIAYFQGGTGNAFYDDIGSQWITWSSNIQWQASSGNGGCVPVGHFSFVDNFHSDPIADFGCGAPFDTVYARNTRIPRSPGAADLPFAILREAGLQADFRKLTESLPPRLEYASPSVGQRSEDTVVLVAGSGFSADATVSWGETAARSVEVLSSNFLVATAPAGAQLSQLRVATARGLAAVRVNDTDPDIQYAGKWQAARYPGNYDDETQHVAEDNGASFSYSFVGRGIEFITAFDRNRGAIDVYVNDRLVQRAACDSPDLRSQQVCARVSGLPHATHVLRVVKTSGQYLTLDALRVSP